MMVDFLRKYEELERFKPKFWYGYMAIERSDLPLFWEMNKDFQKWLTEGEAKYKFDFIWQALSFSLLLKSVYFFSPENYKYCGDYLQWKYHSGRFVMNLVYREKIDAGLRKIFDKLPQEKSDQFYMQSNQAMGKSTEWIVNVIDEFNTSCCVTNLRDKLLENKSDPHFLCEFSDQTDDLSYQFKSLYLSKISRICWVIYYRLS